MEEVLKLKATEKSPNPAIAPQRTLYAESGLSKENPVHLVQGQITTQPTKNIKTTTTVANEAVQDKVSEVPESCGGSDLKHTADNPPTFFLPTKQTPEGVGSLADHQTHLGSTQTKLTSSCGFIEDPSGQSPGRGQLTSCPPQLLSSTSSTRPDALCLPKKINCFSNPSKTNYVQKAPNDTQHGHISSDTDAGTDQKMSAGGIGSKLRKMYRDLSHGQRTGFTDPTGNRAKNEVNPSLGDLFHPFFKLNNLGKAMKKWCRHESRKKN